MLKEWPNSQIYHGTDAASFFPNDSSTRRHEQTSRLEWDVMLCTMLQLLPAAWSLIRCCFNIDTITIGFDYRLKKRVDVKPHELHACICYFSDNFTRHVWRRFKAVRQRMTSCTCLKGLVCIILLQKSGSLKEFRKINNIKKNVQWHLRACTWNSAFAVTIFF